MVGYLHLLQPLREGFKLQAVLHAVVANAGAPQGSEISSAVECLADVASQCADVGAFAAHYSYLEFWRHKLQHLNLVNDEGLGLQLYFVAAAGQVVGVGALYLACRVGLSHSAPKSFEIF